MNCADAEILICDYVDGTLAPESRAELEQHVRGCRLCEELLHDSAAAVEFIGRAEIVEPPPELITRILFEAPWSKGKPKPAAWRKWVGGIFSPILQPKLAMGMAMTILSLSLLLRFVVPAPYTVKDWKPSKIWASVEMRANYAWGRTVKFYDNLKLVYQIQNTLHRWQQQDEEQHPAAGANNSNAQDERKLPTTNTPAPERSGAEPSSNPKGETR
jgi:hypothetical protein